MIGWIGWIGRFFFLLCCCGGFYGLLFGFVCCWFGIWILDVGGYWWCIGGCFLVVVLVSFLVCFLGVCIGFCCFWRWCCCSILWNVGCVCVDCWWFLVGLLDFVFLFLIYVVCVVCICLVRFLLVMICWCFGCFIVVYG